MTSKPSTVDFETEAIRDRPDYPPEPVGVGIWEVGRRPKYMAWGHPCNNNCTREEARRELLRLWRGSRPLLFHHAQFDLDVGETHLGLPAVPRGGFHDTEPLMFLNDPYAKTLSLKPLSEQHLDMPPEEQEELRDWIVENYLRPNKMLSQRKRWGAYIAKAPGDVVGKYAIGDVRRTSLLWTKFYPSIVERGMRLAYEKELQLTPIIVKAERRGVPVRAEALARDVEEWKRMRVRCDRWICKRLGMEAPTESDEKSPVDQREEFADALEDADALTEWVMTDKGNRSTAIEALDEVLVDRQLFAVLKYRSLVAYGVNYVSGPRGWLRGLGERGDGRLYLQWNTVRQDREHQTGRTAFGARTGRLSSTPNWQNVATRPATITKFGGRAEYDSKRNEFVLPAALRGCVIPRLRDYVVAPRGRTLLQRDYSQQELRILAEFEAGLLQAAYLVDPTLDQHEHAKNMINELLNADYERRPIKDVGFGLIYGLGLGKLARKMEATVKVAKRLKGAYLAGFPGLKELLDDISECVDRGDPIYTGWGREYYCEPPVFKNGRKWDFRYKLINYKVQGTAAECTKQALINLDSALVDSRFLLTVHDEFLNECQRGSEEREMELFREAMLDVDYEIPMLSDGKYGSTWGKMRAWKRDPKKWWVSALDSPSRRRK